MLAWEGMQPAVIGCVESVESVERVHWPLRVQDVLLNFPSTLVPQCQPCQDADFNNDVSFYHSAEKFWSLLELCSYYLPTRKHCKRDQRDKETGLFMWNKREKEHVEA